MIGTLIGGPLTGGYLLARNFKMLNQPEKMAQAWLIAVVAFFILLLLAFLFPQLPGYVLVLLYGWMGHLAAEKLQGNCLTKHQNDGGSFYNNWRAAGIGVAGFLVLFILFLGLFFVSDAAMSTS